MLHQQIEENTLKLHTDGEQRVWYSKNIGPPVNSGMIADEFLRSSVISGFGNAIRVLGVPQNAELVSALYLRRHKGEVRLIEVAGPNALAAPVDLNDPLQVLLQLRRIDVPAACGGWHPVTTSDYPTYAMLARMLRTNFVFDSAAEVYLKMHPANRALQFIPTVSRPELARLLTTIIDPRWYVDQRMPERAAKLELFLGLIPDVQARVSTATTLLKKAREFRCANVLLAWKTVAPEKVDLQNPANFLYRICAAHGGGPRGDLRASQAFIRYLRNNWLEALDRRGGPADGLFAPDLFFKSPAEVAAFHAHMRRTGEEAE